MADAAGPDVEGVEDELTERHHYLLDVGPVGDVLVLVGHPADGAEDGLGGAEHGEHLTAEVVGHLYPVAAEGGLAKRRVFRVGIDDEHAAFALRVGHAAVGAAFQLADAVLIYRRVLDAQHACGHAVVQQDGLGRLAEVVEDVDGEPGLLQRGVGAQDVLRVGHVGAVEDGAGDGPTADGGAVAGVGADDLSGVVADDVAGDELRRPVGVGCTFGAGRDLDGAANKGRQRLA